MNELNPQPIPPHGDVVRVHVSRDVAYDLKKMNAITASVLGKLGCPGCHSGHLLDFKTMQDFVVNPQTLDVTEIGRGGLGGVSR